MITTLQRTTLYWFVLIVNRNVQRSQKFKNGEVKVKVKLNVQFILEKTTKPQREIQV
jgi:hypothetical protein